MQGKPERVPQNGTLQDRVGNKLSMPPIMVSFLHLRAAILSNPEDMNVHSDTRPAH